jgi:hypothetical protein
MNTAGINSHFRSHDEWSDESRRCRDPSWRGCSDHAKPTIRSDAIWNARVLWFEGSWRANARIEEAGVDAIERQRVRWGNWSKPVTLFYSFF